MGTSDQMWKIVLLCCLSFHPVYPLRCYQCSSTSKPECGDEFRVLPSDATNCPAGSRCVKYRGFRGCMDNYSGAVKDAEVYRTCTLDFNSNGCRSTYFNGIDQDACVCDRNYCNGGPTFGGMVSAPIILVALVTAVLVLMI